MLFLFSNFVKDSIRSLIITRLSAAVMIPNSCICISLKIQAKKGEKKMETKKIIKTDIDLCRYKLDQKI